MKLRDILITIGKVHLEDIPNNIYVAMIPGGFAKKNYAIAIFKLLEQELDLAVYAEEGIINQHTSKGVINEFTKCIEQYISNENEYIVR